MKTLFYSRDRASKGAALMIVLAFVVLLTGLALAYFSRAGTDRQLAQSSHNDTNADLLTRSALGIVVGDLKQEIITYPTVNYANIQPTPYPAPIPTDIPNLIRYSSRNAAASRASNVSSAALSANGRSISTARWNSHYLIPRGNTGTTIDSSPVPSFVAPDWVLVTPQGPNTAPPPSAVIGRYAFAVYDEGGLLDMSLAGAPIDHPSDPNNRSWPSLSGCSAPSPTPWLVNVGRKGIVAFADLTALPAAPSTFLPQSQVDNIVGWRNYAMTQRTGVNFGNFNPTFAGAGVSDCAKQDWYGSYLLYFGDPPFSIESTADWLAASTYPFTSVATYVSSGRTDQAFMTRQQLLKLRSSLGFSQNVLQYMGTFSRERNRPAPDWPNLQPTGSLSEGRFNLSNLALVVPNPGECNITKGKKKGWQTGKNKNHLCGTPDEIVELFGLFWIKAEVIDTNLKTPGHWRYIDHVGKDHDPNPNAKRSIPCFRGPDKQNDFFQILTYALFRVACSGGGDGDANRLAKTFAIGASLIDQYDSGEACSTNPYGPGCDLDSHVNSKYQTHTTVIEYGNGNSASVTAYGMEPNYSTDQVNGDELSDAGTAHPHRPTPAPTPTANTQVISHALSNVGELGYGINTWAGGLPTLDFSAPNFPQAPVLDFFSYNPVSSAYPRAGIVNLYTRNAPVLAAILASTLQTDAAGRVNPPTPVVSQTQAMNAANLIVQETRNVLAGTSAYGPVTQTDLTRAIAARLAAVGGSAIGSTTEQKQSIARALAETGQTRTWNLFIDVIAQTGRYAPGTASVTAANKFSVEGEKRYWLHIALGRDLIQADGSPCPPGQSGCQVDVLGTQLEEVVE